MRKTSRIRALLYLILIVVCCTTAGFVSGYTALLKSSAGSSTSTPPYELIFSAEPGPDVETLQEIAASATTDDEILHDVVQYYNDNRERLSILWREDNPTRLAGFFSMYVVHISTIYGETAAPTSLVEYLADERAHCGTYNYALARIVTVLGLKWRSVEFVGEHAWIEISVDDNWEVFDATTNTWLSQGVDALMRGEARQYRQFYTPMLDINRPDARWHMAEGYDMQRLRQRMPTVGIMYMPPGELRIGTPHLVRGEIRVDHATDTKRRGIRSRQ